MELSSFTNLFQNLQEYVVGILNNDEILQQMGCTFLAENSLDIEYQLKDALNKQGLACVVMTPKATYQGHNGIQQTFTCDELTVQIVENPIINRARLKKDGLDHGTCLDVAKQASDRLAGPQGGYFGKFTTKKIQEAEQGGLLVCTATFGCTVYEKLDAVLSGDLSGNWVEVPFVRVDALSAWLSAWIDEHPPTISGYFPLSLSSSLSVEMGAWNNIQFWRGHAPGEDPIFKIDGVMTTAQYLSAISLGVNQIGVGSSLNLSGILGFNNIYHATHSYGYEFLGSTISAFVDSKLADIDLTDYVKKDNDTPLSVTVPYDYGFTLQTPNGMPLLETIDLNRTSIYSLSTGNVEIAPDGYLAKYPGAGVDTTKLSAWNWITTGSTSIGSIISGEHNAILGEVSEDYVAYNWLIQQGYATSAQVESSLSNYLPLSGGQMTGSITWDYGGLGGPQIYGPYNPQELAFTTTYAPDADKMVFLDFGRIEEAQGQRTIAFVEDIDAVLGDISALIHAT